MIAFGLGEAKNKLPCIVGSVGLAGLCMDGYIDTVRIRLPKYALLDHVWLTADGHRSARKVSSIRSRESLVLPHGNAALQREGAHLIYDAGELADQPIAHPVQRLKST